jgi:hypothetical protein
MINRYFSVKLSLNLWNHLVHIVNGLKALWKFFMEKWPSMHNDRFRNCMCFMKGKDINQILSISIFGSFWKEKRIWENNPLSPLWIKSQVVGIWAVGKGLVNVVYYLFFVLSAQIGKVNLGGNLSSSERLICIKKIISTLLFKMSCPILSGHPAQMQIYWKRSFWKKRKEMKESFNIVRKAPSSEHGKMCNLIFIKLVIRRFSFQQKIRTWTMENRLSQIYLN